MCGLNLKSIGVMVLELYYFVLFRNIRRFGKSLGQKKNKKSFFEHLDHEIIIKTEILVKATQ